MSGTHLTLVRMPDRNDPAQAEPIRTAQRAVATAVLHALETAGSWHSGHVPELDIRRVLWHYREEGTFLGEMVPTAFHTALIEAVVAGDTEQRRALRRVFPQFVDLVYIVELVDDGLLRLRKLVGAVRECGCPTWRGCGCQP